MEGCEVLKVVLTDANVVLVGVRLLCVRWSRASLILWISVLGLVIVVMLRSERVVGTW